MQSVDPLSISDDRDPEIRISYNSDDEDDKFDSDQLGWNPADEMKFDPAQSDWTIDKPKFDSSQSTRSEEIVVVSTTNLTEIFISNIVSVMTSDERKVKFFKFVNI